MSTDTARGSELPRRSSSEDIDPLPTTSRAFWCEQETPLISEKPRSRLDRPVEFGYKAQVVDNADGIVVDHNVEMGNPPDAPMLVPAIKRVGEAAVEKESEELGVKTVAILRKGRPGKKRQELERSRRFRHLVKWRTGAEGRVAHLKRSWGFDRTVLDGIEGASTWCGWGVLAHIAVKIVTLAAQQDQRSGARPSTPDHHRTSAATSTATRRPCRLIPAPPLPSRPEPPRGGRRSGRKGWEGSGSGPAWTMWPPCNRGTVAPTPALSVRSS